MPLMHQLHSSGLRKSMVGKKRDIVFKHPDIIQNQIGKSGTSYFSSLFFISEL